MTRTLRRDVIMRRIKAGKVQAKCTLHLTDDYLFDAATDFGKAPEFVRVVWDDFEHRECEIGEDYREHMADYNRARHAWREKKAAELNGAPYIVFGRLECGPGPCGGAYWTDKEAGLAHLSVHSNLYYDLKIEK